MANSNAYMNEYMKKRYRERRALAFFILGNKCVECGTTENLQIDHIFPFEKAFNFGKLWNINEKDFRAELNKCQLLCKDCHKKKSAEETSYTNSKPQKKTCKCKREFDNHAKYAGHKTWCKA